MSRLVVWYLLYLLSPQVHAFTIPAIKTRICVQKRRVALFRRMSSDENTEAEDPNDGEQEQRIIVRGDLNDPFSQDFWEEADRNQPSQAAILKKVSTNTGNAVSCRLSILHTTALGNQHLYRHTSGAHCHIRNA